MRPKLIVYTSADSVFQIAAHEGLVSVEELYMSALWQENFYGYNVRVIARRFGSPGLQEDRQEKGLVVALPATLLDHITEGGLAVVGIGKIGDIFCHKTDGGIHTTSDSDGIDKTIEAIGKTKDGLIF